MVFLIDYIRAEFAAKTLGLTKRQLQHQFEEIQGMKHESGWCARELRCYLPDWLYANFPKFPKVPKKNHKAWVTITDPFSYPNRSQSSLADLQTMPPFQFAPAIYLRNEFADISFDCAVM